LKHSEVVRAWGRILAGYEPSMSVEVTRRCPLSCPGCYAFGANHLGKEGSLRSLVDLDGQELIQGILQLVDRNRPLHISLVGGEPLVRYKEITCLLPELEKRGVHTQIVTSAVRAIPAAWNTIRKLNLVVSIDGLQPEHDKRRSPATYQRILENVRDHFITVHCTITHQMTLRDGYMKEFLDFWAPRPEVRKIWVSLYTPQLGETSAETIPPDRRSGIIAELDQLRRGYPKLELPSGMLSAFRNPPSSPDRCVFALSTRTISADLETVVKPCQLGGNPDCSQCGCIAAAGMEAVNQHRLIWGIRTGAIYDVSRKWGLMMRRIRAGSKRALHGCADFGKEFARFASGLPEG
jgi:organic radical activating enzyme